MLFRLVIIITILSFIINVHGTFYTVFNGTDKFFEYKQKYNKIYESPVDEQKHYLSFIDNLNSVTVLNESATDNNTTYVLNKYADLNPDEVKEHYDIDLKTYVKVQNGFTNELLKSNRGIEINDNNLHNIRNADEVFDKFVQEIKRSITEKQGNLVEFYRFVKNLTEKNKDAYENTEVASRPNTTEKDPDVLRIRLRKRKSRNLTQHDFQY